MIGVCQNFAAIMVCPLLLLQSVKSRMTADKKTVLFQVLGFTLIRMQAHYSRCC